jgi:GH15 family glucan-1,4-alpha-glucosidase
VYGEMILAVSRLVLDQRFHDPVTTPQTVRLVRELLDQIERRLEEPDAGLWELRGVRRLHTFTLLLHWAGATHAAEIGESEGIEDFAVRARSIAARARALIEERCWSPETGALTQAAGETQMDAALLLALHFGFFAKDDPRAATHVDAIRDDLALEGGLLRRYRVQDDFGLPEAAFTVCSFWLVEALAILDRREEATELFDRLLALHNGLGLYSEDILPATLRQTGNFPQTYSHVGLINAAFRLSRTWD